MDRIQEICSLNEIELEKLKKAEKIVYVATFSMLIVKFDKDTVKKYFVSRYCFFNYVVFQLNKHNIPVDVIEF